MALFQGAHSFTINDGTFISAGGNVYIIQQGDLPSQSQPSRRHRPRPTARTENIASSQSVVQISTFANEKPKALDVVECGLEHIEHLIKPHADGVFNKLHRDICDLRLLVRFSANAYEACRATDIGLVIRRHIEIRMSQTAQTLTRLHGRISNLPYRWVPIWRSLGGLMHSWWTRNEEPEDIVSIRLEVAIEAEEFGRCLSSLKSLHWMQQFLMPFGGNGVSMNQLNNFFKSGPALLRHIKIEEIIIIEPLGKPLAIPIRFIESLEQVHVYVQMGCQGTRGSRYIENNQYQLDESGTNTTIQASGFRRHLKPGNVFEVSILVQTTAMAKTECPRCGHRNRDCERRKVNGWLECQACRMMFNATEVSQPAPVDVNSQMNTNSLTGRDERVSKEPSASKGKGKGRAYQHEESDDDFDSSLDEEVKMGNDTSLFRRLKVEIILTSLYSNDPLGFAEFAGSDTVNGPLLLQVPRRHSTFITIEDNFKKAWMGGPLACPEIKKVLKLVDSKEFLRPFNAYRRAKGNETFIYHGTHQECTLGRDRGRKDVCANVRCSVCSIFKLSFKSSFANPNSAFGPGIYLSTSSNKAYSYCKGSMLLAKVSLGKVMQVSGWNEVLRCPPGYDSVVFNRNKGMLNETVVYNDDAIRPAFLILF